MSILHHNVNKQMQIRPTATTRSLMKRPPNYVLEGFWQLGQNMPTSSSHPSPLVQILAFFVEDGRRNRPIIN